MAIQPPAPSITPRQMTLMRVVAAMAWSDGNLATEEVDLMLDQFSSLFAATAERQQELRQELQEYLVQNVPMEESVPTLKSEAERALVLRLGYEVINASARTPEEAVVNQEECAAYQRLVSLLDLPPSVVAEVEAAAQANANSEKSIVDRMADGLRDFIQP